MLRVEGSPATVLGAGRVRLFQRGREPRWFEAAQELTLEPSGK